MSEVDSLIESANNHYYKKEFDKAFEFYKKAEMQSNPRDYYALGVMYLNGEYVKKDSQIAMSYFEKVKTMADDNDPIAQNSLGSMYYKDEGVKQGYKEAIRWYRKTTEQGYSNLEEKELLDALRKILRL